MDPRHIARLRPSRRVLPKRISKMPAASEGRECTRRNKAPEHPRAVKFRRALGAGLLLAVGCAGYAARVADARRALDGGDAEKAVKLLNAQLGVDNSQELPAKLDSERALNLLSRATLQLRLRAYSLAARDFGIADKQIELLDFSRSSLDEVGRFLFSDDAGSYRAPLYEKLLINPLNLLAYLAEGKLSGARVEARRFSALLRLAREQGDTAGLQAACFGIGLSASVFWLSGKRNEALRFDEDLRTLGCEDEGEASFLDRSQCSENCAYVLAVATQGRVPAKVAVRLPIGLALTYGSAFLTGLQTARAQRIAAQGLVTWVNFPSLEKRRYTQGATPMLTLNGRRQSLASQPTQLRLIARAAWEQQKGRIIAAAIVRTLTRAAIGVGAQKAAKDSLAGVLLSLGTQAALTARDTPDTRSWWTLPGVLQSQLYAVPTGTVKARFEATGRALKLERDMKAGDYALLLLSE